MNILICNKSDFHLGVKTKFTNHIPSYALILNSFADFSPIIVNTWYKIKNNIETKTGIPNPPFLIIDPRDDPIKNSIKQAIARLNFRCHSIWCLVIIIFIVIITTLTIFVYKTFNSSLKINEISSIDLNDSDITNPKFTINSEKQKISISASDGNFINSDEILLKNDVIFKSKKFTIYSDNVIFNKDKQTATSIEKSKFVSNNTSILSDGFEIIDEGNKIKFNGKTKLEIKWKKLFWYLFFYF